MITDAQAHSMGHALGEQWRKKRGKFYKTARYRNYASYSERQSEWDELVSLGLAVMQAAPSWCGTHYLYQVTPEGGKALDEWNAVTPVPPWCR